MADPGQRNRPNPRAEAATSRLAATDSHSTAHDRLLNALHAAGCKVSRGRSQCPAHESRGLTLAVRETPTGVVLHCHAGCSPAEVVESVGLTLRDLFDSELPAGYTPPPRREPSPWDVVTDGPGWDHLLDRISREQALEADPGLRDRARDQGDTCRACVTDDLEAPAPGAEAWVRCTACGHTAAVAQSVLDRMATVAASCACGGELR